MASVNLLISLAVVAWLGQVFLGWVQLRRFNRAFDQLAAQGRVGIGRAGGRFSPRVLVAISLDEDDRVNGSFAMKGLTVFSAPQPLPELAGMALAQIDPPALFPQNQAMCNALALAISNKR
ncbi:transcriptional regulator GutM [Chimaeribacter arupi]|uniref:transcriptional regulator GutM n=1 Tax=Yersiniaceae TaxID=1903411 RepID=UPI00093365AD|nr:MULTISPECIES: transcriptional regulator GutM [Yersiniaceae]MDV5141990.1 transcriptional regulator GutM [Chimaeribacter arupi]PLR31773.1 transcriptional regulator GutM [Chimaeribacter arupi]PLR46956.1 transcriptional regulator GutM [Chimaeribacter arupi]PLR53800.1 transcriptional regulator GutM [Chimaeribacter arupi]